MRIINFNWLNRNQGLIQTILTIVLVLITGFYAYQTYQLNQINSNQFEVEERPYLKIEELKYDNWKQGEDSFFTIETRNEGKNIAYIEEVKIEILREGLKERAYVKKCELYPHTMVEKKIFPNEEELLLCTINSEEIFGKEFLPIYININYSWYRKEDQKKYFERELFFSSEKLNQKENYIASFVKASNF